MKLKNLVILMCFFSVLFINGSFAHDPPSNILIVWPPLADAVSYEIEISTSAEMDLTRQSPNAVYQNDKIFAPGVEIDTDLLPPIDFEKLFYRVRALNIDNQPISTYDLPKRLSNAMFNPIKPYVTSQFYQQPVPLYLAYSWIPVLGASRYEVEVFDHQPKFDTRYYTEETFAKYMLDNGHNFDCYDWHAYIDPGTYYWRVIALDESNNPIGTYSDPVAFIVSKEPEKFAAFGDSITHGGGAISNPPCDLRYDYTSYFPFPVKNLGKSGDTIQSTVERFDADVLPFHPSVLFIMAGSNSIRGGESAENVINGLEIIKQKSLAAGIIPVFITLPPINSDRIERVFGEETTSSWRSELKKVNAYIQHQEYSIDVYSLLVDPEGNLNVEYSADGLHPDISGKKIIAQTILQQLQNYHLLNY